MYSKIAIDAPWTKDFFRYLAKEYVRYPRKGFNAAKQEERILKLLRDLEQE
jgi:hypothetical protein